MWSTFHLIMSMYVGAFSARECVYRSVTTLTPVSRATWSARSTLLPVSRKIAGAPVARMSLMRVPRAFGGGRALRVRSGEHRPYHFKTVPLGEVAEALVVGHQQPARLGDGRHPARYPRIELAQLLLVGSRIGGILGGALRVDGREARAHVLDVGDHVDRVEPEMRVHVLAGQPLRRVYDGRSSLPAPAMSLSTDGSNPGLLITMARALATLAASRGVGSKPCGSAPKGSNDSTFTLSPATFCTMSAR